jgi:transcriptional regulator with XRE-family HTH domain
MRIARPASWHLPIYKAAERLRYGLGWSKSRLAAELGVNPGQWVRYENGRHAFSLPAIELVRETFGIDIYVLAYCLYNDTSKLPPRIQELLAELRDEWTEQIERMHRGQQRLPFSLN